MTRRALVGFVIINIVVSVIVVALIILIWDSTQETDPIIVTRLFPVTQEGALDPQVVVVTQGGANNGILPNEAYERTITALNANLTSQARRLETFAVVAETAGFEEPTSTPTLGDAVNPNGVPPLDPTILGLVTLPSSVVNNASSNDITETIPDDGCERYVVEAGDFCSGIAERFNVNTTDLIALNDIDAACTTLREGQILRIPGPSCQLPPTPTASPTITRTPFIIGTFVVTNTPAPTAEFAEVRIIQTINVGDVTNEQLDIENQGDEVVDLLDWSLSDSQGNVYTFPDVKIQPGQIIRIFTRVGQNTPAALYWNRTVAVWEVGDIATLYDAGGASQSTYTVISQEIDFEN